jgi:hypothetical protein
MIFTVNPFVVCEARELLDYLANCGFFADLCYLYFHAVSWLGFRHHYDVALDF